MPLNPTLTERQLANVSGLLALLLLVAAGAMMTFRRSLLARTRYADGLRTVHVVVSALAGLFLIIHVAALISFPLTFDALLGYVASGAALLIWITGETYLKGVRRSLPPHTLLSLAAVWLILFHAYGGRIGIPTVVEGLTLTLIASALLFLTR